MSPSPWSERLAFAQAERERLGIRRQRRVVERREGRRVFVDGRPLIDFCSNDYLGLADHPAAIAALQAAATQGLGSGGSALLGGHHPRHAAFEREAAEWLGHERALFFPSGYQANLAVLQGLLAPGDRCVQDKLNHASLLDAARLAGGELRRYPHADAAAASRQLQAQPAALSVLATDGVFSMDGDIAPLPALARIAAEAQALFLVDEAHGVGVLGPEGRGACAAAGLGATMVPLRVLPLGKAFGAQGALVLGDVALIEHLLQSARPYLFSTAALPALAAALSANLQALRRASDRREQLHRQVARFRDRAQRLGLPLLDSTTPIQPLLLGGNARALALAEALEQRGYWAAAVRPPTVPEGKARLRITLTARHEDSAIDGLLDALAASLERIGREA